ncbi:hypothetical protein [Kordiimonas sediminis]|uniref:hypothetical protein n=1 Tax=Kordiimonas sediminis TaxID=1735581 RepID=UPI0017483D26|nr:hypothetical protein [Kordiimonas sediminis]
MTRFLCQFFGIIFLILSIPLLLTPIPFGLLFLLISLLLLIPTSTRTVRVLRYLRRKSKLFDTLMHQATSKAPSTYRRILRRTETDYLRPH